VAAGDGSEMTRAEAAMKRIARRRTRRERQSPIYSSYTKGSVRFLIPGDRSAICEVFVDRVEVGEFVEPLIKGVVEAIDLADIELGEADVVWLEDDVPDAGRVFAAGEQIFAGAPNLMEGQDGAAAKTMHLNGFARKQNRAAECAHGEDAGDEHDDERKHHFDGVGRARSLCDSTPDGDEEEKTDREGDSANDATRQGHPIDAPGAPCLYCCVHSSGGFVLMLAQV
jgi:hypothetical protein